VGHKEQEKTMSYAADGPLEPNLPEEVSETFLPDVMGYKVLAIEWSDDTCTLHISNGADLIEDGEFAYDSIPDEDLIRTIIEEALEGRADASMQ
jgi:hypothetical protein